MVKRYFGGGDAGSQGCLGVLRENGTVLGAWKLTDDEIQIVEAVEAALAAVREDGGEDAIFEVAVELVGANRQGNKGERRQGASTMFAFGRNFGALRGVLAALRIRRRFVTPGVWQKKLNRSSKGDKSVLKRAAQQLWPSEEMPGWKHDGLLIAEHLRRVEVYEGGREESPAEETKPKRKRATKPACAEEAA